MQIIIFIPGVSPLGKEIPHFWARDQVNTDSVSVMKVNTMHKHARKQEGIVGLTGIQFPSGINSALQDEPRELCSFHK